jgi:hypothetical protein
VFLFSPKIFVAAIRHVQGVALAGGIRVIANSILESQVRDSKFVSLVFVFCFWLSFCKTGCCQ